jgi:aspartate/methionine/tyrosine aminotransferase
VTGWKTGYCIASPELMKVFRQIYQFANFCGVTPVQMALANFMQQHPEHIDGLASFINKSAIYLIQVFKIQNLALFHPKERFSKC